MSRFFAQTIFQKKTKIEAGFTFLELLVVVAIMIILFATIAVLVDPSSRYIAATDARRRQDVQAIEQALTLYQIDQGSFPPSLSGQPKVLGTQTTGCDYVCVKPITREMVITSPSCLDLQPEIANYLPQLPTDPTRGDVARTMYAVWLTANDRAEVASCAFSERLQPVSRDSQ